MGLKELSLKRIDCQPIFYHTPTQLLHGPLGESQSKISFHLFKMERIVWHFSHESVKGRRREQQTTKI